MGRLAAFVAATAAIAMLSGCLGLTIRHEYVGTPPPPQPVVKAFPAGEMAGAPRYQIVAGSSAQGPIILLLDTSTGHTWQFTDGAWQKMKEPPR